MQSKGETLPAIMDLLKSNYYHKNISTQKRMRRKYDKQIRDIYNNIQTQLNELKQIKLNRTENKEVNDFFCYFKIV